MRDELSEKRLWVNEVRHAIETQGSDGKAVSTLYEGLTDIEDSFTDYPTLLYDGPFSEHIMQADPLMLKGKTEIDETTAKATAAKMTGVPVEKLQVSDNEDGKMSSFVFEGEGVHAAVTKQGGYCDYFLNSREIGEAAIDYNQAVQKAKEYANGLGLGTFKDSYYMTTEGICVVNLAYMQGDTVCYTDLIKVGVALDNGQIVSYNARGFLMNHKQRDITAPRYSAEQARQVISPLLTVKSSSLALVPTDAMEEKHCYEFACTSPDGKNILVYVNTDTLQEDNILILLQTDGGTLTL